MPCLFELELLGDPTRLTAARLYQRRSPQSPRPRHLVTLEGAPLGVVSDFFHQARSRQRPPSGRQPLEEADGIRLGLLFTALKPLSKPERIWAVAEGVRRMADEEALYWFSRCLNGASSLRARRALRILLAPE